MMKVLVINTVRFKLNGISAVIMNYYKAMDKTDMTMDFVAIDMPSGEYQELFQQYEIKCFVVSKSNLMKYFFNLIKIARKGNYDIAHVHGNSANMAIELFACLLAGIKVRIAHSHNTSTLHPTMHRLLYPLFKLAYTHGFACGTDAGHWLFHNRDFVEIKNGIDLNVYKFNEAIRNSYRKKIKAEDRIVIGHVGNFIEQKNHSFLLDWFAELIKKNSNYLLLMISDGYLLEQIKEKASIMGISNNVIFLGKTLEVQNYLQAMDIFVLPSLHEGLPVVLVEAQSNGLPCFVADTVARESNITGAISFLPITSTDVWVNAILETTLCDSRLERCITWQKMISESGYDINRNANRMKDLYSSYIIKYKG